MPYTFTSASEADLNANRMGQVSPAQREFLRKIKRSRYQGMASSLIIITIIPGFALLRPVIVGEIPLQTWLNDFPNVALPLIILFPLIFLFSVLVGYLIDRDLRAEKISSAAGEAELWMQGNVRKSCYVRIGDVRFRVSREEWNTFTAGQRYRVYFIRNYPSHLILSVELNP